MQNDSNQPNEIQKEESSQQPLPTIKNAQNLGSQQVVSTQIDKIDLAQQGKERSWDGWGCGEGEIGYGYYS